MGKKICDKEVWKSIPGFEGVYSVSSYGRILVHQCIRPHGNGATRTGVDFHAAAPSPDSPIDRAQGEARLWRPGQTERVLIYDLLVRGTVDKRMYQSNQAGASLLKELLSGGKL